MDHALLQERYQTVSVVFSIFFVSCKQILSHTLCFGGFSARKKKKKAYVSVLTTYSGRCLLFFHNKYISPDVQLFRGLQTDQLNLINIQVKITFLGLCLQHSPLILILKMFSRRQLEILNPQEHCWKTFNLTPFTCTPILFTDCMKMSYYSVLKIDVESSNIPWVKNIFLSPFSPHYLSVLKCAWCKSKLLFGHS